MQARNLLENRNFIREHTRPLPVEGLETLQLWQADDVTPLWEATEADLDGMKLAPPFWAFAWAGGVGLARFILDHPEIVRGRSVLDLACGSGLVGLAAARAGASLVISNDIDPMCEAAVSLNIELNFPDQPQPRMGWRAGNLLEEPLRGIDVILVGDVFYEHEMANAFVQGLKRNKRSGIEVYAGDPGRTYAPTDLGVQGEYRVATCLSIENAAEKVTRILAF
jgi:predicted nicotinamide N-methyase